LSTLDGNLNPIAWTTDESQQPTAVRIGQPQASTSWDKLLHLASGHPINLGNQQGGIFTYADVLSLAVGSLGSVAHWQFSATMLQQLWTVATGGKPVPAGSPGPSSGPPSGPSYYQGTEQGLAIICADSPGPRDSAWPRRHRTVTPAHGTGRPPARSW